jgi:hypothetical protein
MREMLTGFWLDLSLLEHFPEKLVLDPIGDGHRFSERKCDQV